MSVSIVLGDCREQLRLMESESVHCCVTSPPYFNLRDYQVAGQIGIEPTPDAYVAEMVGVFRDVRRVLRDDGTLWLNLGDSYAGSWGAQSRGGPPSASSTLMGNGHIGGGPKVNALSAVQVKAAPHKTRTGSLDKRPGLKSKDLIGIPWRVAFALQQPYYSGTIRDERDRIWLAAMLDAEGCMFIHKRKAGQSNGQGYQRQSASYSPGLEIANTSLPIIERIMALVGKGSICSQGPEQNGRRRQTIYRWNLRSLECRDFVRELYPHLVAKQQQARILCGHPSSGPKAEAAHAALIGLHRGSATDIDFPAPETMFEPGWLLRQDIIWKKPNPMPESVRDRCTKAHEYIFLLSKSERYFYDADAIKEPASENTHARLPGNKRHSAADAYESGDWRHRTKAGLVAYAERKRAAAGSGVKNNDSFDAAMAVMPSNRNKRSVWTVGSEPFNGAHFATFPPALIEPMILAGCPKGGTVLDPFGGAGTTGLVADRLGRNAVLIELNPSYADMARRRISGDAPLLADVVSA